MSNQYLISWDHGYGENGTYTAGSTAELLDIFDLRVQRDVSHFIYQRHHDIEDYEVSPLIGSTNPLTDIYEIVKVANEREPGVVIEGQPVTPTVSLWFASYANRPVSLHSFGSEPASAVSSLLAKWSEIVAVDGAVDPSEIHDNRQFLRINLVTPGTAYGMASEASRHLNNCDVVIAGDDPSLDDIFQSLSPAGVSCGL